MRFLAPEFPAGSHCDPADSVARGRSALLFRLGKFDSRRRYGYGVCPDRCLDGAEKILVPDMVEVKLCMPDFSIIEQSRNYEHACTRFVASDFQFLRSRGGLYPTHPIRASRKHLASGYEVVRYLCNNQALLLSTSTHPQRKNADQRE